MLLDRFCVNCDYLLENLIEKMEDNQDIECPICHKISMSRILHYSNTFCITGYNYSNGYSNNNGH